MNPNGGAIALGHPIGEAAKGLCTFACTTLPCTISLVGWPARCIRQSLPGCLCSPRWPFPPARPSAGCSGARQTVTLLHELARRNNSGGEHKVGRQGCTLSFGQGCHLSLAWCVLHCRVGLPAPRQFSPLQDTPSSPHCAPSCTLLHPWLQGPRYGVVSMCVGSGMGAAAVFETNGMPAKKA